MRWPLATFSAILLACAPLPSSKVTADSRATTSSGPVDSLCGETYVWKDGKCANMDKDPNKRNQSPETKAGGFVVIDLTEGTGPAAKRGDAVKVHYTGSLADGTVFDTSRDRGPLEFEIGKGTIKGFARGVEGMKKGGTRRVTIPPELGYGDHGAPPKIPPRATLTFELELVEIE